MKGEILSYLEENNGVGRTEITREVFDPDPPPSSAEYTRAVAQTIDLLDELESDGKVHCSESIELTDDGIRLTGEWVWFPR